MKRLANSALEALKCFWGYNEFRESQIEAVELCERGENGLLVMQTSGGKSICFQAPALAKDGTCIVVSPLVSLMRDQVQGLERLNIPATFINSTLSFDESNTRLQRFSNAGYKFLYVSPERLISEEFQLYAAHSPISMIAIDEAHCISTWGHDFRSSYTKISSFINNLNEAKGYNHQIFGYTATATPEIRKDILKNLNIPDAKIITGDFRRSNIQYEVRSSKEKIRDLVDIIRSHEGEPTIVYTSTVKSAIQLSEDLINRGYKAAPYHGSMKAFDKNTIQDQFLNNELQIVVATNAFGMGVDKPDIRNVIHYQLPGSIENFYQESGRAGRDGESSRSYLLYSKRDIDLHEFLIDINFPKEDKLLDILNLLRALDTTAPEPISSTMLCQLAVTDIKEKYIPSILRVLESEGFITIHNHHSPTDSYLIDTNDVDISIRSLSERRKAATKKLMTMEGFAKTPICKETYILNYLGDISNHDDCGKCSSCSEVPTNKDKIFPKEKLSLIISSLKNDKLTSVELRDSLAGINNSDKRFSDTPLFGLLKNWTFPNIELFINHLRNEKILDKKLIGSMNYITASLGAARTLEKDSLKDVAIPPEIGFKGVRLAHQEKEDKKALSTGDVINKEIEGKLKIWRNKTSKENKIPEMMVMSNKVLISISKNLPNTVDDLIQHGMSKGRAAKFGNDILDLIKDDSKKIDSSIEISI